MRLHVPLLLCCAARLDLRGHLADHPAAEGVLRPLLAKQGARIGEPWPFMCAPCSFAKHMYTHARTNVHGPAGAHTLTHVQKCAHMHTRLRRRASLPRAAALNASVLHGYTARAPLLEHAIWRLEHTRTLCILRTATTNPIPTRRCPLSHGVVGLVWLWAQAPVPSATYREGPACLLAGPLVVLERLEGGSSGVTLVLSRKPSLVQAARSGMLPCSFEEVRHAVARC